MSNYNSYKHLERKRFGSFTIRTGFKVQNKAFLQCGKWDCQNCNKSNYKTKSVEYNIPGEGIKLYRVA